MKIKTYSLLLIILLFSGVACTDLEEVWYDAVVPETFFKTEQDVKAALYRSFTHARWYVQEDRWQLQEMTADQFAITTKGPHWYNGGENYRYHYHQWTVNDGWIWGTWRGTLMGVALALDTKQDLEKLDYTTVGLTDQDKAAHVMQLQTLIAYFYLRGLDYFGGLPIFTSNEGENIPRSTDKETFDHIENLLLEAIPSLPKKVAGEKEEGAIRQAGAATMLAQLYFNAESYIGESKFAECATVCQDIIDGKYGDYTLDPTWNGVHGFYNNESPEVIWSAPSEFNKLQYDWMWNRFYHYETFKYFGLDGGAWNGHHLQPSRKPTGELYTEFKLGNPYEKFNDADLRKKPYLYKGGGKYEGMFLVGDQISPYGTSYGTQEYKDEVISFVDMVATFKRVGTDYPDVASLPSTMANGEENTGVRLVKVPMPNLADESLRWSADNTILRLAEVYYMLAECKFRAGDKESAASLINSVRARYFEEGNDPDPVSAAYLDKYRFLDEWGVEFLAEGRRRTDLIRWNMFTTENWWDHEASNSDHLRRFPVPQDALSGNNALIQNPGYN
ncbi:RagB/SusD family nutrient uptake outer membrane protein [uncultured Draconibacterium sp.]|uniref:RagB/SusD family nutrient uptake outer membrane protein n=1 Tax=uncultured Draconibacterium sp. TaxID=1573823 RepID=UPI00321785F5